MGIQKNSYFGHKYLKIKKRRGHKKAIIAISRMMLVPIYHMILKGETFNPSDYESFAIRYFIKKGTDINTIDKETTIDINNKINQKKRRILVLI